MIVLLQRVKEGAVEVDGRTTGRVGVGFVALVCAEGGHALPAAHIKAPQRHALRSGNTGQQAGKGAGAGRQSH